MTKPTYEVTADGSMSAKLGYIGGWKIDENSISVENESFSLISDDSSMGISLLGGGNSPHRIVVGGSGGGGSGDGDNSGGDDNGGSGDSTTITVLVSKEKSITLSA